MRSISRRAVGLGATLVVALTGLVALGRTVPAHAATGCRVAPFSATVYAYNPFGTEYGDHNYDYGPYYTTSQCVDINFENIGSPSSGGFGNFYACVVFVNHTDDCNYWTYMPYGQWKNIATNVKDGTKFMIRVDVNWDIEAGIKGVADF